MSRIIAKYSAVTFLVCALGCSGENTRPATFVLSDSAGVQIATNLSEAVADTVLLPEAPQLEIGGGENPETPLFRISDVEPLTDSRVAIATDEPRHVVIFDQAGMVVDTLGRPGDGPGEFRGLGSVVEFGQDSLAVWDPVRRRLSIFSAAGAFIREVDLSDDVPESARGAAGSSSISGFTELLPGVDHSFLIFAEGVMGPAPAEGPWRPALTTVLVTSAGEKQAEFGPFDGMEIAPSGLPVPLGLRTDAASLQGDLVISTGEATELHVFAPSGDLRRTIRWPDHDRTVDEAYLAQWSQWVESSPDQVQALARAVPPRSRYPAQDRIVVTQDGRILVGEYPGPQGIWPIRWDDPSPPLLRPQVPVPTKRWRVFARDGRLSALAVTPEGFEPYAVRDGVMWGVFVDSLGIESVRAYAFPAQ